MLAAEQAALLLVGVSAGVGLGIWASYLFIPFLQFGSPTPPFVVRIAWNEIAIVALLFVVTLGLSLGLLLSLLARLRLFQAVKMGEMV